MGPLKFVIQIKNKQPMTERDADEGSPSGNKVSYKLRSLRSL